MTIAAIIALLHAASWPALATVFGGGLSALFGAVAGFWSNARGYLIAASLVALVVAAASVTVWIKDLESKAATAARLENREFELGVDMKCGDEKDVLVCFQTQKAAAEEAKAKAVSEQQALDARERDRLTAEGDQLKAQLAQDDKAFDADQEAKTVVPAAVGRAWDRKRARMGVK